MNVVSLRSNLVVSLVEFVLQSPVILIILNSAHALLIINWFLVLFEFLIVVYLKGYSEENEVTMLFRFKKHNLLFSKHFFSSEELGLRKSWRLSLTTPPYCGEV